MQSLNIIGGGRLGMAIGHLAHKAGYRIAAVYCRDLVHAQQAVAFIGDGLPLCDLAALPPAELNLLSVPDAALASLAETLAAGAYLAEGSLAFHASGVAEAALLSPLAGRLHCASWHPAFSFAEPARSVAAFAGTRCALEGDEAALPLLEAFTTALGAVPFRLAPGGKAAYHAALCVASNYLVTLHDLAQRLAGQGGMSDEVAQAVLGSLMRQTLENTLALGPRAALTGPISRADVGTLARHRAVLTAADDALYCVLGQATATLAASRLSAEQLQAVREALLLPRD